MNITSTEWKEIEQKIADDLARRWPWLVRSSPHFSKLRIETPVLTASAELEWRHRDGSATIRTRVGSSVCLSGGLAEITEGARQICEVRDALSFVYGMTAHLVVWPDGECPCGYCGGKGTSQGSTCPKCDGKGKR